MLYQENKNDETARNYKNCLMQIIQDQIEECQIRAMVKIKLTHSVAPMENPLQIRSLRRSIAKLKQN